MIANIYAPIAAQLLADELAVQDAHIARLREENEALESELLTYVRGR